MGRLVPFPDSRSGSAAAVSRPLAQEPAKGRGAEAKVITLHTSSFLRFLQRGWESAKVYLHLKPSSKWMKATQAVLLAVAVCFSMGASNAGSRVQNLDHRLMCTCGCAQLLGECNHVGCTESTEELAMLRTDVAAGMSDQQIFDAFSAKYGATVLAAPPAQGFDLVAWIAPFAVFLAALLGTILLIRRWGGLRGFKAKAAGEVDIAALDPAERERRERIRRETEVSSGFDGGSTR